MIDVIIATCNSKIEKCLLSIATQTIKDDINVYVIDNGSDKKYDDVIDKFKKLLNINLIRIDKKREFGYAKQVGLDKSSGKYVFFMKPEDSLYDCYSLENLKNCIKGKKFLVFSYIYLEKEDGNLEKIVDEGNLYGKLFCRSVIEKDKIKFNFSDEYEGLSFYYLYCSSNVEIIFSDSISYICSDPNSKKDKDKLTLENCKNFVDNLVWYVKNAGERKFDKCFIGKNIYRSLMVFYHLYMDYNRFLKDKTDLILKYSKVLSEYYRVYRYYLDDAIETEIYNSFDNKYVPFISFDDFLILVSEYNPDCIHDDLISIIVPIYNKEKYLAKTIESILNQTYKNFELLLIDDCSIDKSVEICEKYQKNDSRIRIIKNEKNSGVSKTRNVGIENAKGKYICFVDADDTIKPNMYEILHTYISEYDLDFVQCMNVGSKKKLDQDIEWLKGKEKIFSIYLVEDKISDTVWSKMFKKDILKKVRFNTEYRKHEDTLFIFDVVKECNNICLLKDELYNYHNSSNSLTNVKHFDSEIKLIDIVNIVESYVKEKYSYLDLLFYWYKCAKVLYFFSVIKNINFTSDNKNYMKKLINDLNKFVENAMVVDYHSLKKYNALMKILKEYKSKIR